LDDNQAVGVSLRIRSLFTGLTLSCLLVCQAATPRYTILHHFAGSDGAKPSGPLLLSGSTLFGTTYGGGTYGGGTVFKLNADGSGFNLLKHFESDGTNPYFGLALAGSSLFGTTTSGGRYGGGVVFRLETNGSGYQVLLDFTNSPQGTAPRAGTLVVSGANLYGPAENAGNNGYGKLFRLGTDGSGYTELQEFDWNTKGGYPQGITLSGDTLYGTTSWGGSSGGGTVFKLLTDGSGFTVLCNLGSQDLTQGLANGGLALSGTNLYGTTTFGGSLTYGAVFKVGTDGGGLATLANFPTNEQPSVGVVLGGDTLYGMTCGTQGGGDTIYGNGTLFMVKTNGTDYRVLRRFSGPDGANSRALLLFSSSTLYGTTPTGGAFSNGVVFSLTLAPVIDTPPQSQVVPSGFAVDLAPGISGLEPLSYQWFFNTTNAIPGATNSLLTLSNVQVSDSGAYTLVVANAYATVTSAAALLVVTNMPPILVTQPASRDAGIGAAVDFSVVVGGSIPQAYQWLFNGTDRIPAATNTSLHLANVQPSQSGAYALAISNAFGSVTSPPAILQVRPVVVTNATEAALLAAMAEAGGIVFACDGTITLTSTLAVTNNTVLDATGHQVTISGTNVRLFYVNTNITFGTRNLTIANGYSPMGGGIFNDGGTLELLDTEFRANLATNAWIRPMEPLTNGGRGGAILNQGGTINATNCRFSGNIATTQSIPQGEGALGGAICNPAGRVNLDRCIFTGNIAQGGPTTADFTGYPWQAACPGRGGAVYSAATLLVNQCTLSQNLAGGGSPYNAGNSGAPGIGGGIYNLGLMAISGSLFVSNSAVGGAGMPGRSSFPGSGWPGSPGGYGGQGLSAALFNSGTADLVNSTFVSNQDTGGTGGNGGSGSYVWGPHGGYKIYTPGGPGGLGGDAFGAICSTNGTLTFTNCTMAYNTSIGGPGGLSGAGGDLSGGGHPSPSGVPGGALVTSNALVLNTIIAANSPSNCMGRVTDTGHNISSDPSCAFTANTSLNNTDPRLGSLSNNGGPTLTLPLLAGSPAIDAGNTSLAPATDQRGFPRPAGLAADIGAFEYGSAVQTPFGYTTNNGTISITGYWGLDGAVTIPDTINGLPITSIGTNAFLYSSLTSVMIPNSVTGIGDGAFYHCSSLTNITIPNSVTSIGSYAFCYCSSLTAVHFNGNAPSLSDSSVFSGDYNATVYYLPRTTGWGPTLGGLPTVLWNPPTIQTSPQNQTAEASSAVGWRVEASSSLPLFYLWYLSDTNLISWGTNPELELTSVQFSQSGAYTVMVTNGAGAVTSAPAMLNVIAAVERRPAAGVQVMGEAGSLLNVDYANSLGATPNWLPLDTVTLVSTSQYCFDVSEPLPPQRFYRARQTGTPSVIPSLSRLGMVPAITLTGNIGHSVRVDYINQVGPINAWVTLATVTLTNTSQLYFDTSARGQPDRLYRVVQVP
jgi:uncharacterized repeat protein (TIGR03803 family)